MTAPQVPKRRLTLPTDSAARKRYPVTRGALLYFPAAISGVARISMQGNEKHNPGQPMHHARGKSTDHSDCVPRHILDTEELLAARARGDATVTDASILDEVDQMAWRALAYSQAVHELLGAPLAPAAREPASVPAGTTPDETPPFINPLHQL